MILGGGILTEVLVAPMFQSTRLCEARPLVQRHLRDRVQFQSTRLREARPRMLNRLNSIAEKLNICEPVKTSARSILIHFLLAKKYILINGLPRTKNIGFLCSLQVRITTATSRSNPTELSRRYAQPGVPNYCPDNKTSSYPAIRP